MIKTRLRLWLFIAIALFMSIHPVWSQSVILLEDNFDTENGGNPKTNGYNTFAKWEVVNVAANGTVTPSTPNVFTTGAVDLFGGPNNLNDTLFKKGGIFLDMDAQSSLTSEHLRSKQVFNLVPGEYELKFVAFKDARPGIDTLVATVHKDTGNTLNAQNILVQQSFEFRVSTSPFVAGTRDLIFQTVSFSIFSPTQVRIYFDSLGNDNIGILLDDIFFIQKNAFALRDLVILDNSGSSVTLETPINNPGLSSNQVHYVIERPANNVALSENVGAVSGSSQFEIDKQAGHSLYLPNGEFAFNLVAMEIPARGMSFLLELAYRSRINFNGIVGRGWDYSLNKRVVSGGNNNTVIYYDGKGRGDAFTSTDGINFASPAGHFKKIVKNSDGSFSLRDKHGAIYQFFALDGSLKAGKLDFIQTRCGNKLTCNYSAIGQMVSVQDHLGRAINHTYDTNGLLTEISDFTGRKVSLEYDVKERLLNVNGPLGESWGFAYNQVDIDNEQLNHNLVSVVAPNQFPAGQAFLVNTYNAADEVISQQWGDGEVTRASTAATQEEAALYPGATRKVVVNDRRNTPTSFYFNQSGHLLAREEVGNIVTKYQYNNDGLLTETVLPEGNKIVNSYDAQGNVLSVAQHSKITGEAALTKSYVYEPLYNQVWKATDERGHTTEYIPDYFEASESSLQSFGVDLSGVSAELGVDRNQDGVVQTFGNTIVIKYSDATLRAGGVQKAEVHMSYDGFGQLSGSRDAEGSVTTYSYSSEGYLAEVLRDNQVSTKYNYDAVGNITSVTDGRGVRTDYEVSQLNQVVQVTRAADVSASTEAGLVAHAYKVQTVFDKNNNVLQTKVQYRDGNNDPAVMPSGDTEFLSTTYTYDILGNKLSVKQTVNNNTTAETRMKYDANNNLVRVQSPVAFVLHAGNPNTKDLVYVYDERDLVIQEITSPDGAATITTSYQYNKNGKKVSVTDGRGLKTEYVLDGYDRVQKVVNAEGEQVVTEFDAASNIVKTEVFDKNNVSVSRTFNSYDERGRMVREDKALFVPSNLPVALNDGDGEPGDSLVSSFVDYDRNNRVTTVIHPSSGNAQKESFTYDGLSRITSRVDAEGNEVKLEYDKNNNPVRVTRIDKNQSNRVAAETFVTLNQYDSLNRLVRTEDNLGQSRSMSYDSRDFLTKTVDAHDNVSQIVQDGLGRVIEKVWELRQGGSGNNPLDLTNPANSDGLIKETFVWDLNSRLVSQTDDRGNTTSYEYDNLNRLVRTLFADGTSTTGEYDNSGNLVRYTDQNGSVSANIFDSANRLVSKQITRSATTVGTTVQTFEYDGLNRITKGTDNNDPNSSVDDSVVEYRYDSLGRVVQELQNGQVVAMNWQGDYDLTSLVYPDNRQVNFTQDNLNRVKTIQSNNTTLAAYDYIGDRVLERVHGNGTRLTMLSDDGGLDQGYDSLGRLAKMRHLNSANALLAGFGYAYNRENVPTKKANLVHTGLGEEYQYDSIYRVTDFKRTTVILDGPGQISIPVQSQSWVLDGASNWVNTIVDGQNKNQVINSTNEYQAFAGIPQSYDPNGNLTGDSEKLYFFDFANRLAEVWQAGQNGEANKLLGKYTYDAFNRRTSKFFTRTRTEEEEVPGEDKPIALYHYEEAEGQVVDSSGNNNHGKDPNKHVLQGVEGFQGKAIQFTGRGNAVRVQRSQSLNSIEDKLFLETYVFFASQECKNPRKHKAQWLKCKGKKVLDWCPACWKGWKGGNLITRPGSYRLRVQAKDLKVSFTIYIREDKHSSEDNVDENDDDNDDHPGCHKHGRTHKVTIVSNDVIPQDEWVHVSAVYNAGKVTLSINGQAQTDVQTATGCVRKTSGPLFLGGHHLCAKLDETKISNGAPGEPTTNQITILENVLRTFTYTSWQLLEEREQFATVDQPFGPARVTRQYVYGNGSDEQLLATDVFNDSGALQETLFHHTNGQGDIVLMTNGAGAVVKNLEYSPYGDIFSIKADGTLEALADQGNLTNAYHNGELDKETGLYRFRNKYYHPKQGRFIHRASLGSDESMNWYEFAKSSPIAKGNGKRK